MARARLKHEPNAGVSLHDIWMAGILGPEYLEFPDAETRRKTFLAAADYFERLGTPEHARRARRFMALFRDQAAALEASERLGREGFRALLEGDCESTTEN